MAATHRDGTNALPPFDAAPEPHDNARRGTDWAPLIVALIVPILLLQVAVVRPNTTQLARMRGQVAHLEATIEELRATEDDTARATGLLAELGQQQRQIARAEAALDRFARLESRLERSVAVATEATASLEQLDALVRRVEERSALLDTAWEALASLADAPGKLHASIDRARRVAPAVNRVRALADDLDKARSLTEESIERVDGLLTQQLEIAAKTDRIDAANEALDGLERLETRLNAPELASDTANDRLDSLVRLKDTVIRQTDDLPAAFDTFELIVNLQEDYRRASGVFSNVHRLMADLLLLEPSIARMATLVEPMIERTTITALGGGELRMVLREMQDRRLQSLERLQAETLDPPAAIANAEPEATVK